MPMDQRDEPETPSQEDRARLEAAILGRMGEVFGANPWLVTVEYAQGAVRIAADLQRLTDKPVMAVGAMSGVGPFDQEIPTLVLDVEPAGSMVANMHRGQAALADPGPGFLAEVDAWNPAGDARAIASSTAVAGRFMGRPSFGARPARWRELEDKLAIEALWRRAGIPVAPSRQVSLDDRDAVLAAHRELATADGTVWAGDNSTGWHGGGDGTFWVPDLAAAEHMAGTLDRFDKVRIMPFVAGVPASMHGMVVPDGSGGAEVLVFRPCEMMMVRDLASHRFVYCRAATFWDPAPDDREAMGRTVHRIGRELIGDVDFRGVFTVDGVVGVDGFVPTEVNTRYGAALRAAHPTAAGDTIDLLLLNLLLIEGLLDDLDLRPLGPVVTAELDRQRAGRAMLPTPVAPEAERRAGITRADDGTLTVTELGPEDDPRPESIATVRFGTADGTTGFAMIDLLVVEVGPPTAPLVVELANALDQAWGLGVPPLLAATPAR